MAGCFSVILRIQILAALALISSTEALKCYYSIECDKNETCVDKKVVDYPSSPFDTSECKDWKETLVHGLSIVSFDFLPEFIAALRQLESAEAKRQHDESEAEYSNGTKLSSSTRVGTYLLPGIATEGLEFDPKLFLEQLTTAEAKIIVDEFIGVANDVLGEVLSSPEHSYVSKQPLCSRTEITFTAKFPTKTLQKTVVVRGCTIDHAGCEGTVWKPLSLSGNMEVEVSNCRWEGDYSNSGGTRTVVSKFLSLGSFFVIGITGFLAGHTQYAR